MYTPPRNAGMYNTFVLFPQFSRCGVGGVLCLYPKKMAAYFHVSSSQEKICWSPLPSQDSKQENLEVSENEKDRRCLNL